MFAVMKMVKLLTEKEAIPRLVCFYGILKGYCEWLEISSENIELSHEEKEFLVSAKDIITLISSIFPEEIEGGEPIKE